VASTLTRQRAGVRPHVSARAGALLAVLAGAALLWLIAGVGFANYDTLYGLVWGAQLSRGELPQYWLPIAPTPHPLVELLGLGLSPLGPTATADVAVALGFLALAGCAWVAYRLASEWFGRGAGAVAAIVLLTRVPILSYGVRAYVDIPYLLLVLGALLVETRRRRAGAPVLVLLGVAGLLRPEAWAFSGLYWLYLALPAFRSRATPVSSNTPALAGAQGATSSSIPEKTAPSRRDLAGLALLAAAAPAIWLLSDLLVTGNAMWSLTNTKHTAATLGRVTGIGNVPQYIPRRIGEILRPAVLAGAALGGVLSLLWLRERARLGAVAGAVAVLVFAFMAAFGLPIDTRYAFVAAAILCVFCGIGAFGWTALDPGDRRRRPWMIAGALLMIALVATLPGQVGAIHRELAKLGRQQHIQDDLLALAADGAISTRCGPIGVPNHAPIPLLALRLGVAPSRIVSAESDRIEHGIYVDPANVEVEREYILDPRDPHTAVSIPPGFTETTGNGSWLLFGRCG
jgi:hypothetical protein